MCTFFGPRCFGPLWEESCVIPFRLVKLSDLHTHNPGPCSSEECERSRRAPGSNGPFLPPSFSLSPSLHCGTPSTPSASSAFRAASRSSLHPEPGRSYTAHTTSREKHTDDTWHGAPGSDNRSAEKRHSPPRHLSLLYTGSRRSGDISAQLEPAHRSQVLWTLFHGADYS